MLYKVYKIVILISFLIIVIIITITTTIVIMVIIIISRIKISKTKNPTRSDRGNISGVRGSKISRGISKRKVHRI